MKRGAVAIIDALGFKGIWKRAEPDAVIAGLKGLMESTNRVLENFGDGTSKADGRLKLGDGFFIDEVRASFLSDTIVVAISAIPDGALVEYFWKKTGLLLSRRARALFTNRYPVTIAGLCVSDIVRIAARNDPTLAFRGAVSFGDFEIDDASRFMVGPAIDEAAEWHGVAEGAFVLATPSASRALSIPHPVGEVPGNMLPYEVPLKAGGVLATQVVSPFGYCTTEDECQEIVSRIITSFASETIDLTAKRQNTTRFLAHAISEWRQNQERYKPVETDSQP